MNEVVIPTLAPVGRATGALVGRLVNIGDSLVAHAQQGVGNLVDLIRQAVQRVPPERLREPPAEQLVPLLEGWTISAEREDWTSQLGRSGSRPASSSTIFAMAVKSESSP